MSATTRLTAALDDALAATTADGRLPGVVAGLTSADATVYLGTSGPQAVDDTSPIRADTVFGLFSATKPVTATVALRLAEQGVVDLDAPAQHYLPALADVAVIEGFGDDGTPVLRPPRTPVALRQLLTHTAGFGYDFFDPIYERYIREQGLPDVATARRAALATPLLFDPGTRWEYGVNLDWAGLVLEGATGRRLGDLTRDLVTTPLGMPDTVFGTSPTEDPRRAVMHHRTRDGDVRANRRFAPPAEPEVQMGGQGLSGTVADYLTFIRMWLRDGVSDDSEQILAPATVREATRNQIGSLTVGAPRGIKPAITNAETDLLPGIPTSWGISFLINDEPLPGRRSAGSLAWSGLANLYFWIDRTAKLGGFWATQLLPYADPVAMARFAEFESAAYRVLRPPRPT